MLRHSGKILLKRYICNMKIFLYLFVALVAVVLIVLTLSGIDGKADTWLSVALGVAVGFLIVKSPVLINYLKIRKQKIAK